MNFGLLGRSGTPEAGVLLGGALLQPQGRLTLASGSPAIVSDVAGATALYYTPAVGNRVPLFTGATWKPVEFSEIAYQLQSANHLNNNNYDVFATLLFGRPVIGTGPAWSSDTGRAAAIERFAGVPVNAAFVALVLSPETGATIVVPPRRALYLGTIRTTANGQTSWIAAPAAAAGGGNARLYLWNMFNRLDVAAINQESANTWSYTTGAWRAANNSTSNRISIVRGLDEDSVDVLNTSLGIGDNTSASPAAIGVGVGSTSAFSGTSGWFSRVAGTVGTIAQSATAAYGGYPGIGLRFFQMIEYGATSMVFVGDNGDASVSQSGLTLRARM